MSYLKVNSITSGAGSSSPTVNANVQIFDGVSTTQTTVTGNVNVVGVITAASFTGDGTNLTNLPGVSKATAFALVSIIS